MTPVYHPRAADLANLLVHQRVDVLGDSAAAVARRGGLARQTIREYEGKRAPWRVTLDTVVRLQKGYKLTPGAIEAVLDLASRVIEAAPEHASEPDLSFIPGLAGMVQKHMMQRHLEVAAQTIERLSKGSKDSEGVERADEWLRSNEILQTLLDMARDEAAKRSDTPAPPAATEGLALQAE